jgi:hypothetical protein
MTLEPRFIRHTEGVGAEVGTERRVAPRSWRRATIGLLIVHLILFGVFWLGTKLLAIGLFTLIGLAIVGIDAALIGGVAKERGWVRPLVLLLEPPLVLYLGWLLFADLASAPRIRAELAGESRVLAVLRVAVPTVMLVASAALLVLAWLSGPTTAQTTE